MTCFFLQDRDKHFDLTVLSTSFIEAQTLFLDALKYILKPHILDLKGFPEIFLTLIVCNTYEYYPENHVE